MIAQTDFDYISKLLKDEAAISIEQGKEYLVVSRLEPVARSLGIADISALVGILRKENNTELKRKIVESLTTHETSFFRDGEPFELLKKIVFPELIKHNATQKELNIWCGAASSGQEPYSVCMLIHESFPELLSWKLRFIATDVSRAILTKAMSGEYNQIEVNRGLPIRFLVKHFEKRADTWLIKEDVRKMIEFTPLNLLHSYTSLPPMDLIMMRNVLIYFDLPSKKDILRRVRGAMKPHGYFFLGTAETTINIDDQFERVAFDRTSCYRKKS